MGARPEWLNTFGIRAGLAGAAFLLLASPWDEPRIRRGWLGRETAAVRDAREAVEALVEAPVEALRPEADAEPGDATAH